MLHRHGGYGLRHKGHRRRGAPSVIKAAGLQGQQLQSEQSVLNSLRGMAQTSDGRMQALQVLGQINEQQVQQLMKLRELMMADMSSKRRPENIAFPRQIAMFLARQMTENSLSSIGEAFGGRDHGTVLHACRLVKDRMEIDANVRQVVSYLEKQLMR